MGKYRITDEVNIYCITDGEFIKVGMSKNVLSRLKQLQTSSPKELTVMLVIPCSCSSQAIMRERQIHKSAKKHRVMGEWFTQEVLNNKYLMRYKRRAFGDLE